MRYAGQHKSTTIKVYTAIHAFTGLPDGARPTVRTIADMAAVSERTVNSATKILMTEGFCRLKTGSTPRADRSRIAIRCCLSRRISPGRWRCKFLRIPQKLAAED
jgi:hypothetical protein